MKKNYYAIIPAYVRYDSELTPNAKLLFGEITALSNELGYCFATNQYFANLYNVSTVSISKWVNQLKQKGYITVEFTYNGKEISERRLFLADKDPLKKSLIPLKNKFKDNNIIINNNNVKKENKIYNNNINTALIHIGRLFPQQLRPKTKAELDSWKDCLDKLERLDGYSPRQVYYICEKTRKDEFWKNNFYSILKLRKKNKEGIKYIDLFQVKLCPELKDTKI